MISLVNTTKEEPLTRITTVYLDFKLSISEGNHIIDSMSPRRVVMKGSVAFINNKYLYLFLCFLCEIRKKLNIEKICLYYNQNISCCNIAEILIFIAL